MRRHHCGGKGQAIKPDADCRCATWRGIGHSAYMAFACCLLHLQWVPGAAAAAAAAAQLLQALLACAVQQPAGTQPTAACPPAVVKNTSHSSWLRHQLVISSNANSTPPTGERKAAATPAAAPHVTRSARSRSFQNLRNHTKWYSEVPPCGTGQVEQVSAEALQENQSTREQRQQQAAAGKASLAAPC
jgi:hypothetical protein